MRPTPPRLPARLNALFATAVTVTAVAALPHTALAAPTLTAQQSAALTQHAIAQIASLPAPRPVPSAPVAQPEAHASQVLTGTCVVQIIRKGKKGISLVDLKVPTLKYRFVKKKGGGFKRIIVSVKVRIQRPCASSCVQARKVRGTYRPIFDVKVVKKKVKRRGKIVKVKRRSRVYRFGGCETLPDADLLGTPVSIAILPGSYALLDFDQFQRQAKISGKLRGFIPGKFKLNTDYNIILQKADIKLDPTNIFIDDLCNDLPSAAIRTDPLTTVGLTKNTKNSSTFLRTGTVTAVVDLTVRLALDLRNDDDGCKKQYITTGYTEFPAKFFLRGKLGVKKLAALQLQSSPDIVTVGACLQQGLPNQPCGNELFTIPLPILISTNVTVKIDILDN